MIVCVGVVLKGTEKRVGDDRDWVDAPAYHLRLRVDGILEARAKPDGVSTLETATATLRLMVSLVGDRGPVPMLADVRALRDQQADARRFLASSEQASRFVRKLALVVGPPVSEVLAAGFVGLGKPQIETRIFHDHQQAVDWLCEGDHDE